MGLGDGLGHEVLKAYLDDIARGTAPVSYEINSWEDLERWFFSNIELQKKFGMTRGAHSEQLETKLQKTMN
jgi:hypothetical protein